MKPTIEAKAQEIFPNYYSISVDIPTSKPPSGIPHVYLALDVSGSMSGEKIEMAKKAIELLIDALKSDQVHISIIDFDDKAYYHDSREIGFDALKQFNQSLSARGGTIFKNVFVILKQNIEKYKDMNSSIIWLTDGQDNDGLERLTPCMEGFKQWILDNKYLTAIHTVGIGEDHDARMLTKMLTYGTYDGTFQFAEQPGQIFESVDKLSDLLHMKGGWGFVKGKDVEKISFSYIEETKSLSGVVFLKGDNLKDLTMEVYYDTVKTDYGLVLTPVKGEIDPRIFNLFTKERMRMIVAKLGSGSIKGGDLEALKEETKQVNQIAIEIIKNIEKIPEAKRNLLLPVCMNIFVLNQELLALMVTDASHGLTNVVLARLNHMVFRGVLGTKTKRLKALLKKGGLFLEVENFLKEFQMESLTEEEKLLSKSSFTIKVNKTGSTGIGLRLAAMSKGKELAAFYHKYGAPIKVDPNDSFGLLAFPVKDPEAAKVKLEVILGSLLELAKLISPEADALTMGDFSVLTMADPPRVAIKVVPTPKRKELLAPIIERLKALPLLGIEDQILRIGFGLYTDLAQLTIKDKPLISLLLEGGNAAMEANLASRLAHVVREKAPNLLPIVYSIMPALQHLAMIKSVSGEMVWEFDDITQQVILASLSKSGNNMKFKEYRAMIKPTYAQWVENVPILGKLHEFLVTEVIGFQFAFYVNGIFGFQAEAVAKGLGEALNLKKD